MKKLFYLLLALPLVFAACEPATPTPEDPNNQENPGNNGNENEGGNENEEDNVPTKNMAYLVGYYYTPEQFGTDTYCYYFVVSDKETSLDEVAPNGSYFFFALHSKNFNDGVIPNGTYTYDVSNSGADATIQAEYSYGYKANSTGSEVEEAYLFYDATVTVTDGKIEAAITTEDGDKFIVVYKGDLTLPAYSAGGGGGYSTLTGDLTLNITDMQIEASNYTDYYGTTDANNWFIQAANTAGKYITLDLLTDVKIADCSASYHLMTQTDYINSFIPGYVEEDYILGCWYCELDEEGYISGVMAPFADGTFEIKVNGNTATITLNCVDDAGNKITGTISGSYQEVVPEASALSAEKRAHRVAMR